MTGPGGVQGGCKLPGKLCAVRDAVDGHDAYVAECPYPNVCHCSAFEAAS